MSPLSADQRRDARANIRRHADDDAAAIRRARLAAMRAAGYDLT